MVRLFYFCPMNLLKPHVPIKDWLEEERPREKFSQKGKETLSDAELLAIFINSGTKQKSAIDIARQILAYYDGDLERIARCSIDELTNLEGIGEAKAITLSAAFELGNRRQRHNARRYQSISSSKEAYQLIKGHLIDLDHEQFWMLILTRSNKVTHVRRVGEGGFESTIADPKKIFKMALDCKASALIFAHNHPSGALKPSQADLQLTEKLVNAGRLIDIRVLDHLIITSEGFFSFSDEGLIT